MAEDSTDEEDAGRDVTDASAGTGGDAGDVSVDVDEYDLDEQTAGTGATVPGMGAFVPAQGLTGAIAGATRGAETRSERVERLESAVRAYNDEIRETQSEYETKIADLNAEIDSTREDIAEGTSMPEQGERAADRLDDARADLGDALAEARERAPEPDGDVTDADVEEAAEMLGIDADVTDASTPDEGVGALDDESLSGALSAAVDRERARLAARGLVQARELDAEANELTAERGFYEEDLALADSIEDAANHEELFDVDRETAEAEIEELKRRETNKRLEASRASNQGMLAASILGETAETVTETIDEELSEAPDVDAEGRADEVTAASVAAERDEERPTVDDGASADLEAVADAVVDEAGLRARAGYEQAHENVQAARRERIDKHEDAIETAHENRDTVVGMLSTMRDRNAESLAEARESLAENGPGYDGYGNRVQAYLGHTAHATAGAVAGNDERQDELAFIAAESVRTAARPVTRQIDKVTTAADRFDPDADSSEPAETSDPRRLTERLAAGHEAGRTDEGEDIEAEARS